MNRTGAPRPAERDLGGGARLLFSGTSAVEWGLLTMAVTISVVAAGLMLTEGESLVPALIVGALVPAELVAGWLALRGDGAASQAWVTDDALVFRLRRGRWLRIPWADVRGGTWIATSQLVGPALRTTGGRDDRPNPTWYAMPCRPQLHHGEEPVAAVALREEFQRRGISWRYVIDDRTFSRHWTTERWDW